MFRLFVIQIYDTISNCVFLYLSSLICCTCINLKFVWGEGYHVDYPHYNSENSAVNRILKQLDVCNGAIFTSLICWIVMGCLYLPMNFFGGEHSYGGVVFMCWTILEDIFGVVNGIFSCIGGRAKFVMGFFKMEGGGFHVTSNSCSDKKIIRLGYLYWSFVLFYKLLPLRYFLLVISCFQSCSTMLVIMLKPFRNGYKYPFHPVHSHWNIITGAHSHWSIITGAIMNLLMMLIDPIRIPQYYDTIILLPIKYIRFKMSHGEFTRFIHLIIHLFKLFILSSIIIYKFYT